MIQFDNTIPGEPMALRARDSHQNGDVTIHLKLETFWKYTLDASPVMTPSGRLCLGPKIPSTVFDCAKMWVAGVNGTFPILLNTHCHEQCQLLGIVQFMPSELHLLHAYDSIADAMSECEAKVKIFLPKAADLSQKSQRYGIPARSKDNPSDQIMVKCPCCGTLVEVTATICRHCPDLEKNPRMHGVIITAFVVMGAVQVYVVPAIGSTLIHMIKHNNMAIKDLRDGFSDLAMYFIPFMTKYPDIAARAKEAESKRIAITVRAEANVTVSNAQPSLREVNAPCQVRATLVPNPETRGVTRPNERLAPREPAAKAVLIPGPASGVQAVARPKDHL